MFTKTFSLSNLTLLVALALSTIAAYYSIIGLTAIFAGAVIPIIVMGSILEIGKIVTTVWLRKYWHRCGILLKLYLVPAVVLLALLTSMGIFGFLSKAHTETGLVSGDSQAKLALYDEKIKTQRDNIELARKALQQMDSQVDQRLARGDSEQGAERAVQIRRQQQGERAKLQKEIGDAQKEIQRLNEERAPIAAENRKIEAEVGPIKYIAALIYGDDTDNNMLEAAVRWVIILLVIVFDPLAIALVLAANASKEWDKEKPEENTPDPYVADVGEKPNVDELKEIDEFVEEAATETLKDIEKEESVQELTKVEEKIIDKHPYLSKPFIHFKNLTPIIYKDQEKTKPQEPEVKPIIQESKVVYADPATIQTEGVTQLAHDLGDYVIHEGKSVRKDALKEMHPEMFKIVADDNKKVKSNFGTTFPAIANKGDMFVRVDVLPNRVYKFDGKRWIEVNKENTDTYLHDREYIKHLVTMISRGQYDLDLLSENERQEIENYLRDQNT